MTCLINTTIKQNRGRKRLWLEGTKLEKEGIQPGMRYDLKQSEGRLILVFTNNESAKYIVSKRSRGSKTLPVIDVTANVLSNIFELNQGVRVLVRSGKIIVTISQVDSLIDEREHRLLEKLANDKPLKICSIFSGGGILDRAVHDGMLKANVRTVLSVVIEREAAYIESSLSNNSALWDSETLLIQSDIELLNLVRTNQNHMDSVDGLIAGLPCTGASKAGRTKNKLKFAESHETAGAAFFYMLQLVQLLNPSWVLLENVAEYENTASMAVIRAVLTSCGYSISERVMCGNDFGVLEKRKRLCVVAISAGLGKLDLNSVRSDRHKEASVAEIIDSSITPDSDLWKTYDYLAQKELNDIAAGKGFRRQLVGSESDHVKVIGTSYNKCRSTEPFLKHPCNPGLSRLFTPAEHCRLKGIPEYLIANLSTTKAHEVAGQSVVFPLFRVVGEAIGRLIT